MVFALKTLTLCRGRKEITVRCAALGSSPLRGIDAYQREQRRGLERPVRMLEWHR